LYGSGFGFGCVWEQEHGLGVMTHRDRVVDLSGTPAYLGDSGNAIQFQDARAVRIAAFRVFPALALGLMNMFERRFFIGYSTKNKQLFRR
jgi:hypothetical protein